MNMYIVTCRLAAQREQPHGNQPFGPNAIENLIKSMNQSLLNA